MSSIHSQRFNINGLDIHYLSDGKGEPLIIILGGSDGASAWMKNIILLTGLCAGPAWIWFQSIYGR
jgi:hypothetical protein